MADIFEIAGRIHSTSQEGVALAANEVKDETLNMKQSELNVFINETKQAVEELSPDQTEALALATDVVNLKDDVDQGAIFDVSEKYPTSGVEGGNTYTLEGALAVLNAKLSTNKKKGGMSIKFVQSSDNKYVQYRLMAQNFTTDVTQWQGVDDEPTAGSDNLVKSGGVKDVTNALNSRLVTQEDTLRTTVNSNTFYVSDIDGNVVAKIFSSGIQAVEFITKNGNTLTNLLNSKVSIVEGKELSSNDYNNDDKNTVRLLKSFQDGLYIVDDNNNIMFKVDNNGFDAALVGYNLKKIIRNLVEYNNDPRYSDSFYITDLNGNVIFSASRTGVEFIGKNSGGGGGSGTIIDDGYKQSDIVYNIYYGRSLSYHGTCDTNDSRYTNLAFKLASYGSIESMLLNVTNDIIDNQEAMDALFLGFRAAPASNNIILANRALSMFLKQENNISTDWEDEETLEPEYQYQFLGCNPGQVATWSELADSDGLYYKRLLASVRYAKKFADELGKTFSVGTVCWTQAEDTPGSTPKTRYDCDWVAASKLNHDIKAITGQTDDIYFLTYQIAYNNPSYIINSAIGELNIWLNDDDAPDNYVLDETAAAQMPTGYSLISRKQIQMGPIMDALSYNAIQYGGTDHLHATEKSYHAMAAQFGLQMKRCMYDKNPTKPIHCVSHTITQWDNGKYIIRLKMYVPVKPLVFDTTGGEVYSDRAPGAAGNYGFSIINGSNNEIIESVEIVRGDEIKIVTTENPTGFVLWYAKDGWEHGGNLRDSQDITYQDTEMGVYHIHNWCPIFNLTLN